MCIARVILLDILCTTNYRFRKALQHFLKFIFYGRHVT